MMTEIIYSLMKSGRLSIRVSCTAVFVVALFCMKLEAGKSQDQAEVRIDPRKAFQKIEGFGASIIGWREDLAPMYQDSAYLDFVVNQLGLSIFRMQIWPNVSTTPIERIEDIRHEDFEWDGPGQRGKINMDFAKRIREINPDIKIIGSIWSPPAWMKDSKKIQGTKAGFLLDTGRDYDDDNRLSDDMYEHYAKWVYEWVEYMKIQGIPLYALGPQNELMFTEPYESCLFTPEEFARLVWAIGKRFEMENAQRPIIYGPEDMTLAIYEPRNKNGRHTPYVDALMEEDVAPYFDVFATHGYTDGVEAGGRLDPKRYWESIQSFGRPYWITEGGTGGHEWPVPIENGMASYIHHALVDGNVSAFVCWQISDEERNTHGVMELTIPTKKTYAAMHYWKFVRPGFQRVLAETKLDKLRVSAFRNPDSGQLVLILINDDVHARKIDIKVGDESIRHFIPYTTSEEMNFAELEPVPSNGDRVEVVLSAKSITTLLARR